eukprot:4861924-Prymnesium_polylepis.1
MPRKAAAGRGRPRKAAEGRRKAARPRVRKWQDQEVDFVAHQHARRARGDGSAHAALRRRDVSGTTRVAHAQHRGRSLTWDHRSANRSRACHFVHRGRVRVRQPFRSAALADRPLHARSGVADMPAAARTAA